MASEISQVNGIEPTKTEITEKVSSPVKSMNAVIIDSTKHMEAAPSENGASNNITHHDSTETNGDLAAPETKTEEPKATVQEPEVVAVVPPVAEIEPMETDQLSTPPEKVPEKADIADDVPDAKPVEETSEKAVEETTKSDDVPSEEVAVEKPVDEAAPSSPKKPGRKPVGRKPATPKKTSSDEAVEDTTKSPEKHEETTEMPEEVASAETAETTASAKRTPRKKRESAAADTDGDKTPLLEAPLVVEGKRSRQKTDRLDSTALNVDKRDKELNVPEGTGVKLGEIPFIESMISKTSPGDLKVLHRIAFGKIGAASEVKKHIRQFNGFDFAADSKEYEKKRKSIENLTNADLKLVCSILGLEKSGKKEELLETVMKFCVNPTNSGKSPAPAGKRTSSAHKGKRKAGPGRKSKKAAAESGTEEEAESTEPEEEKGEEDEETLQPTPKRGRPSKASTTSPASAKATPGKRAAASSPTRSAKKPAFPTDTDIKSTIKELLKGVNLEEVTMKEMTAKVYEKYPGADLTNKKDFIKDTVKSLLSTSD